MRLALAALLSVLIVVLFPSPAVSAEFEGERELSAAQLHPDLRKIAALSARYWDSRNVPLNCPGGQPLFSVPNLSRQWGDTSLKVIAAVAREPGCGIYFDLQFLSDSLKRFPGEFRLRRTLRRELCLTFLHEDGHNRGKPHTPTGVMADEVPWECKRAFPLTPKRKPSKLR